MNITWELLYDNNFKSFVLYLEQLKSLWIKIILIHWWLNINADEIVQNLASQLKDNISNIIFLTWKWWILDNEWKVVSFLTKEKVKDILDWNTENIKVEWWMLKNLETIYSLFKNNIAKVTIANLSGLKEELEWFGSWTMVVDIEKAEFKKLESKEMFDLIYTKNIKSETWNTKKSGWKARTQEEKDKIFNNYITLEVEGTILWWYALSDHEIDWKKWKLLECIFTPKLRSWIWSVLWEEIKKHNVVFAYSKEGDFFEYLWFKKIDWKKSESGAFLYMYKNDLPNICVIWSGWAVWVKLKELLENHPIFKNCLSETIWGLSKLKWYSWEKEIISILETNEIVVLAVHDDVSKEIVNIKEKVKLATKIIDCSTAHRVNQSWTYGLPELKKQKEKIKKSELLSNPWCHATAAILSIKPLMESDLVYEKWAVITSTTGYSWGWKEMISIYEQNNKHPAFQYSTWFKHKHESEIEDQTGLKDIIFQPEVVNYFNGLKTNSFLQLTENWKNLQEVDFIKIFETYYFWKWFIKILKIPNDGKILMNENNKTQNISIYIKKYLDKIQIITVIDNMMKWAAWAVIQNMNIMLWLDEKTWLLNYYDKKRL